MRFGIVPPTADAHTHSSAYQTIVVPANAESVELTFWYKPFSEAAEWNSLAELRLLGYDEAIFAQGSEDIRKRSEPEMLLSNSVDYQECVILTSSYGYDPQDIVMQLNSNSRTWTKVTYDLGRYRGQTRVLYFNAYNNGVGGKRTWMYVDDVEVNVCYWVTPTPPPYPPPSSSRESETVFDRLVEAVGRILGKN
jgi:hypothetical protein